MTKYYTQGTSRPPSPSPWVWEPQMEGIGMLLLELRKALWSPLQAPISMRKAHGEWTEVS